MYCLVKSRIAGARGNRSYRSEESMTEVFYWFGATLIFGGVLITGLAIAAMKK